MQLVILAAGRGVRLGSEDRGFSKCMSLIQNGQPYLGYQIESFLRFSFSKKIIVTGYEGNLLHEFVDQNYPDQFEFVMNPQFHLGSVLSILAAKETLNEDFFIFNADHFYSMDTYHKIFDSSSRLQIFCDRDRNLTHDDMKVYSTDGVLLNEMSKSLVNYSAGYVGVSRICQEALPEYWCALEKVLKTLGPQSPVEAVMNQLCQHRPVELVDVSGSWWTEIDTPEDLEQARRIIQDNYRS